MKTENGKLKKYKLGEICKNITDGEHGTVVDSPDGKYFLLSNKNIVDGKIVINATTDRRIDKQTFDKINKRTKLEKDDVLISTVGTLGKLCIVDPNFNYTIQRSVGVIKPNQEKLNPNFLKYLLMTNTYQNLLQNTSKGAVQKCIFIDDLKNLNVSIPPLESQQKIAAVLSALDDKISLNRRMNAKLEQMAKRLYDHWFVQFDFPFDSAQQPTRSQLVSERSRGYKSSGGKMEYNEVLKREIPARWEVQKLGDVCEIVLGGTPSTANNEFWENGTINWLNSGEVGIFPIVESEKKITEIAVEKSTTEFLKAGSVTLSITRYLRPSILTIDACINQSVVGIKENDLFKNSFLYPYLQNEIDRLMSLRTGAQQPHINKEIVEDSFIIIPPKDLMDKYKTKASPIYSQIINIAKETQKLTALRDRLLPLLINGQVEVK